RGREDGVRRAPRACGLMLLPTSPAFLALQASRRGEAGGLCFTGRRIAYGELAVTVDELAAWLARRGLGAGQPVGVLAANEPAVVAMLFTIWGIGAIAVPIAVRSTAGEAAHLSEPAQPRAGASFASPLPHPRRRHRRAGREVRRRRDARCRRALRGDGPDAHRRHGLRHARARRDCARRPPDGREGVGGGCADA